jgi:hypothetical protein
MQDEKCTLPLALKVCDDFVDLREVECAALEILVVKANVCTVNDDVKRSLGCQPLLKLQRTQSTTINIRGSDQKNGERCGKEHQENRGAVPASKPPLVSWIQ